MKEKERDRGEYLESRIKALRSEARSLSKALDAEGERLVDIAETNENRRAMVTVMIGLVEHSLRDVLLLEETLQGILNRCELPRAVDVLNAAGSVQWIDRGANQADLTPSYPRLPEKTFMRGLEALLPEGEAS